MGKRPRSTVVAAVVTVGVLVFAACGTVASLTTGRAIGNAFKADLDQSSLSVRISLGLTASQLVVLAERAGVAGFTSQEATETSQEALAFDWVTGHGEALSSPRAASDADNSFELEAQLNNASSLELRLVNRTFFARADLSGFLVTLGHGSRELTNLFNGELRSANAVIPGIAGLENGGWVSVPVSAVAALERQVERLQNGVGSSQQSTAQASLRTVVAGVRKAFSENATYANAGDHGGRTEYTLSLALAPFVQQVLSSFSQAFVGSAVSPATIERGIDRIVQKIPASRRFTADLWVKDNKAQEIDIDLAQFDPKLGMAVPLRIVIGSGVPVAVPAAATPLDLGPLGRRLAALSSSLPTLTPGA